MRLVSIASGSSGNCIYAGTENTHILIDAGISNKRIEQGLNDIGVKGSELDGVFITHEHSDHVKGLGVLARKHGVPIYATEETIEEIKNMKYLGQYPKELFRPVLPDVEVSIGDMEVKPFPLTTTRRTRWLTGFRAAKGGRQWPRIWAILISTSLNTCRVWTLCF